MAHRLLAAGHGLTVWNRTAAKAQSLVAAGARQAGTPAEAVDGADLAILCLLDAAAVETVVFGTDGLAQATRAPAIVVDHGSIAPAATRSIAQRLQAACGVRWVDAPVSGGVAGAQAGTLTVMCGGDPDDIEAMRPALSAYAARVTRMGPVGAGQATKLCNQVIVAANIVAINEAVRLAQASGVDAAGLAQALSGGWADSKPLQVFAPRMLAQTVEAIGASNTMLKDVDTALSLAREQAVPLPLTSAAAEVFRQMQSCGLGDADPSRMVQLYRR
jgi:3-hydroxyisobutyrate dehydrogenase-like beta-hydroxyacid dehydrogenase